MKSLNKYMNNITDLWFLGPYHLFSCLLCFLRYVCLCDFCLLVGGGLNGCGSLFIFLIFLFPMDYGLMFSYIHTCDCWTWTFSQIFLHTSSNLVVNFYCAFVCNVIWADGKLYRALSKFGRWNQCQIRLLGLLGLICPYPDFGFLPLSLNLF